MPLCFAALLAACSPVDDQTHIVGEVIQTLPGPDGGVTATLTRDGRLYRVYLAKKSGDNVQKMMQTEQDRPLRIAWQRKDDVMLYGLCGGSVIFPLGTGNHYPYPDTEHGIGTGFSNRCD